MPDPSASSAQGYLIAFLLIYNLVLVWALAKAMSSATLGGALQEKSQKDVTTTSMLDGTVRVQEQPAATTDTSASRVALLIGGLVMAVFLWALGNVVIYTAMTDASKIATLLDSVGTFFLSGSALFAPYAFNQLGTVFQRLAGSTKP